MKELLPGKKKKHQPLPLRDAMNKEVCRIWIFLQKRDSTSSIKNILYTLISFGSQTEWTSDLSIRWNRRSNQYFRVYQRRLELKFEHEMKVKFIEISHSFLISNQISKFEEKLSSHFFLSFFWENITPSILLYWLVSLKIMNNSETTVFPIGFEVWLS